MTEKIFLKGYTEWVMLVIKRRSPIVMKLLVIILYVLPVFVLISNFKGSALSVPFTPGKDSTSAILSISSNLEGTVGFMLSSDSNIMLILGMGSVVVHTHAMSQATCGCCVATIAHPCIITLSWRVCGSRSSLAGIGGFVAIIERLGGGVLGVLRLGIVGDPLEGDMRIVTSELSLDRVARNVFEVITAVMVSVSPSSIPAC